jgi:outer membrane protein OmpA-like peptidoglycan-associated protein
MKIIANVISAALLGAMLAGCATPKSVEAPKSADPAACAPRQMVFYFGSWETELNALSMQEINAVQAALKDCRIEWVRIVGMAGAPGDAAANIEVSQKRAENVAAALEKGGWPRSAFVLEAKGEDGAMTSDGLDKPMRRRVEVSVNASAR